jgi:hypothetical protein
MMAKTSPQLELIVIPLQKLLDGRGLEVLRIMNRHDDRLTAANRCGKAVDGSGLRRFMVTISTTVNPRMGITTVEIVTI